MERYAVFLVGIYGKPIETLVNELFKLLHKTFLDQSFILPDLCKPYHFIWTVDTEEMMDTFMKNVYLDKHIQVAISYDSQEKTLAIQKGNGDVHDILDQYEDVFCKDYEYHSTTALQYIYAVDRRNLIFFGNLHLN